MCFLSPLCISLPLLTACSPADAHHCYFLADARLSLLLAPTEAPARPPTADCHSLAWFCYSPITDAHRCCSPTDVVDAHRPYFPTADTHNPYFPTHDARRCCSLTDAHPPLLAHHRLLLCAYYRPPSLLARSRCMTLYPI
jgi:hypothetical protein